MLAEGLERARAAGVTGKAVTPFLLDHLHRATGRPLARGQHRGGARQRVGGGRHRGGMGGARDDPRRRRRDGRPRRPPARPAGAPQRHAGAHGAPPRRLGRQHGGVAGRARRRGALRRARRAGRPAPPRAGPRGAAASTRAWRATRRTPTGSIVVLAHDRSMFTDRGANLALARRRPARRPARGRRRTCTSRATRCSRRARAPPCSDLVARAGVPWSVDPASHAFVADTPFLEWTAGASRLLPQRGRGAGPGRRPRRRLRGPRAQARAARACASLRRGAEPVDVPAVTAAAVDPDRRRRRLRRRLPRRAVRGEDDEACARAAVRAATEAVSRPGARPR